MHHTINSLFRSFKLWYKWAGVVYPAGPVMRSIEDSDQHFYISKIIHKCIWGQIAIHCNIDTVYLLNFHHSSLIILILDLW